MKLIEFPHWIVTAKSRQNLIFWLLPDVRFFVSGVPMKIAKILNNNVVVALDERGSEQVVMGRGLAFQKRAGDTLETALIEKVFALQNDVLVRRLGNC